jgi:hypothetical protein
MSPDSATFCAFGQRECLLAIYLLETKIKAVKVDIYSADKLVEQFFEEDLIENINR